jgi:hypothetical protein
MVDRIDERDGAIRVLDYKTFAKPSAHKASFLRISTTAVATRIPSHPEEVDDTRVSLVVGSAKKASDYLWKDLQPLYAVALGEVSDLGYYVLGSSEGESGRTW